MEFPYYLSENVLTVYVEGRPFSTEKSNGNWDRIVSALGDDTTTGEVLIALIKPIDVIGSAIEGISPEVAVRGGELFWGDQVIHSTLASRVVEIINQGFPATPWLRFVQNVFANPWEGAREELYDFLDRAKLPITPDGCFIAYKIVDRDYWDSFSHTIENKIGTTIVMPGGRAAVDPDNRHLCSRGLHFCSKNFLPSYGVQQDQGGRVLLIKVNPADVVSVPTPRGEKARTWRYEVVGEITRAEAGLYEWPVYATGYGEHDWTPEDDDDLTDEDDQTGTALDNEGKVILADSPEFPFDIPAVPETEPEPVEEPTVQSSTVGEITPQRFTELKGDGTLRELARRLGISPGTVQSWKTKLFGKD